MSLGGSMWIIGPSMWSPWKIVSRFPPLTSYSTSSEVHVGFPSLIYSRAIIKSSWMTRTLAKLPFKPITVTLSFAWCHLAYATHLSRFRRWWIVFSNLISAFCSYVFWRYIDLQFHSWGACPASGKDIPSAPGRMILSEIIQMFIWSATGGVSWSHGFCTGGQTNPC